jgi:hypothetical protein
MSHKQARFSTVSGHRLYLELLEKRLVPGHTLLAGLGLFDPSQFQEQPEDRIAIQIVKDRGGMGACRTAALSNGIAELEFSARRPTADAVISALENAPNSLWKSGGVPNSVTEPLRTASVLTVPPGLAVAGTMTPESSTIWLSNAAESGGSVLVASHDLQKGINAREAVVSPSLNGNHAHGVVPDLAIAETRRMHVASADNSREADSTRGQWSGFDASQSYSVGDSPRDAVLADFNGDGMRDLATANQKAATVSVLLGTGSGTLQSKIDSPAGFQPNSIAAADFNADGFLDLAVANRNYFGTISILFGNGSGAFQRPVSYDVGLTSMTVATADFNGDGLADIVNTNNSGFTISVLINTGNGSFLPEAAYSVTSHPSSVQTGDLDGDGAMDLAVTLGSGFVSVFRGQGDGTFKPKGNFAVGTLAESVAVGDLSGDGILDLAIANQGSGTVSVLLGNGNLTFQSALNFPAETSPASIVAADVDGDGDLDLAVANSNTRMVTVLRNALGKFRRRISYSVADSPFGIVAGDLNGDGASDLVSADEPTDTATVLLNKAGGFFVGAVTATTVTNEAAILAHDLDSDGALDLAVSGGVMDPHLGVSGQFLSVVPGKGNGSFKPKKTYEVGKKIDDIVAGDFDGDGNPDLAFADSFYGSANVILGAGTSFFRQPPQFPVAPSVTDIVAGDFNGDGLSDIAAARSEENGSISVFLGNGDGGFQNGVSFAAGSLPTFLKTDDFNNDGKLDLISLKSADQPLSILLGNGDGSFMAPIFSPNFASRLSFAIGDFDGDGKKDAAVAHNDLQILRGNGDGTLALGSNYTLGKLVRGLGIGDFNDDDMLDLVAEGQTSNGDTVAFVLLGNGDGTFQTPVVYQTHGAFCSGSVQIGDFNNDDKQDFSVMSTACGSLEDGRTASTYLGNGDGSFQAPIISAKEFAYYGGSTALIDFDADGVLDLVGTTPAGIYRGLGDGSFQLAQRYFAGSAPISIAVSDFNDDDLPDIALLNIQGYTTTVGVTVLLNLGAGFAAPVAYPTAPSMPASSMVSGIAVGDFDGDGLDDLVAANTALGTLSVFHSQGAGVLKLSASYAVSAGPASVIAQDLDGDGFIDLASSNSASGTVSVLIGTGDGNFQPAVPYASGSSPQGLVVGNLNGDSILDLAVANNASGSVSVLIGAGGGTFLPPLSFATGPNPAALDIGDFDEDGVLDLATVNNAVLGSVSVLLGRGDGSMKPAKNYVTSTLPLAISAGDLNGDTYLDLSFVEKYGASVLFNGGA